MSLSREPAPIGHGPAALSEWIVAVESFAADTTEAAFIRELAPEAELWLATQGMKVRAAAQADSLKGRRKRIREARRALLARLKRKAYLLRRGDPERFAEIRNSTVPQSAAGLGMLFGGSLLCFILHAAISAIVKCLIERLLFSDNAAARGYVSTLEGPR